MLRAGSGPAVLCVPGFADSTTSWRPLVAALDGQFDVIVVDLPGFGASPASREPVSIARLARTVADLVRRHCDDQVTLVGHSLGSVIAVGAAQQLGARCSGLMSFEGNLTPEDAYFSGQAADHDDPVEFKRAFSARVDRLVAQGHAPSSYADSVRGADAETMWTLGRDARVRGADGGFGAAYLGLRIRTRYFWASSTTPPATQRYLAQHTIAERQLPYQHHWPWSDTPDAVARLVAEFIDDSSEPATAR